MLPDRGAEIGNLRFSQQTFIEKNCSWNNKVEISSINFNFVKDGADRAIPFRVRVTKSVNGGGREKETLFRTEKNSLLKLNQLGNPFIPNLRQVKSRSYEADFLFGENMRDLWKRVNFETKITLVRQTIKAVEAVRQDGFINLDYSPRNMIVEVDYKTGKPQETRLIDFEFCYPISKRDGSIRVNVDLLRNSGFYPSMTPPELRHGHGNIRVDGAKALVWTMAKNLLKYWFNSELIFRRSPKSLVRLYKQAVKNNPAKRPEWEEFINFFNNLEIDKSRVESSINARRLKEYQGLLGRPDTEIAIDERQMNQALDKFSQEVL